MDARLAAVVDRLRDSFMSADLAELGWIPRYAQLADCLTKRNPTGWRSIIVAPWILFATLGGITDGKCICCSDRSAGTPTLTVSWTPRPSFYWFFMCSISFSDCQYLVLDVIPLFNVDCHRLRSGRVTEGLFP
jgi:hypothetical protein